MPRGGGKEYQPATPDSPRQPSEWAAYDEGRPIYTGYVTTAIAFSPEGMIIAGHDSGENANKIDYWDPGSGEKVHQLSLPAAVRAMSRYDEGQLLVARADGMLSIVDEMSGEEVERSSRPLTAGITTAGALPSGVVLSRTGDNIVHAWVPKDKKEGRLREAVGARELIVLPGGLAVFAFDQGDTVLYNSKRPKEQRTSRATILDQKHTRMPQLQRVVSAAVGRGGEIALGDTSGVMTVVNMHEFQRKPRAQLKVLGSPVSSVLAGQDGTVITAGMREPNITVWDTINKLSVKTFPGHEGGVRTLSFSPQGAIVSSGGDEFIRSASRRT